MCGIQSAIEEVIRDHIYHYLDWGSELGLDSVYDLFVLDFKHTRNESEVWVVIDEGSFTTAKLTFRLGITSGNLDLELFGTQYLYTRANQELIMSLRDNKQTLFLPYVNEEIEE